MKKPSSPSPFGFSKFVKPETQATFEKAEQQKLSQIQLKVKHFELPELNYGYQKSISYSQFSTWAKCPHSWKLSYVDKLRPFKDSIHTIFGTAMHETLQNYLQVMFDTSEAQADTSINLKEYFQERLRTIYSELYKKSEVHFTTAEEMREFYDDGCEILDWFHKYRSKYFNKNGFQLVGIEVPLRYMVSNNIYLGGFIDLVIYDERQDKIIIFDLKTSSRGWNSEKKDNLKLAQILLYKEYFAKQFDFPVEKIEVEFFILKRKIYQFGDFPNPRIQQFVPPSGKGKIREAVDRLDQFVKNCFDENGKHIEREHPKIVGMDTCKYCPFYDKMELCDRNKKPKDKPNKKKKQ